MSYEMAFDSINPLNQQLTGTGRNVLTTRYVSEKREIPPAALTERSLLPERPD